MEGEVECFRRVLPRLRNLLKLRIELPNSEGMSARDLKALIQGCKRCHFLKSFEVHLNGLSVFPRGYRNFGDAFSKLRKLERTVYSVQADHVPVLETNEAPKKILKPRRSSNLKSFAMKFAVKTGWASYYDGAGFVPAIPGFLASFVLENLISISLTFDK